MSDLTHISNQLTDLSTLIGSFSNYDSTSIFGSIRDEKDSTDSVATIVNRFIIGSSIVSIVVLGLSIATLVEVNKIK